VYCARCHTEKVLPVTSAFTNSPTGTVPEGIRWPLIAARPPAGVATGE
jgi:hypothetical protein